MDWVKKDLETPAVQTKQPTYKLSLRKVCDQLHEHEKGDGVIPAHTYTLRDSAGPGYNRCDHSLCQDWVTHSEAMKLHSEEERGTYSAIREVNEKT